MERGHLARIGHGGRDARAPCFAGETFALRDLYQREGPSTGIGPRRCPTATRHECRAEDRLRRQTPVNGRRPCGGVQAASPVERGHLARIFRCGRDARAPRFADGVEADSSMERGHLARIGHGGRDARAPGLAGGTPALPVLPPARRPVGGRRRTTSCPRSFLLDPRPLVVPVVDLQNLLRRFRPGRRLTTADRFIAGLGMRTKTALEPIPKVHLPPGTEQGKGKRASGSASKTRHDFSRPHPRPLSRKRERGGGRIGS